MAAALGLFAFASAAQACSYPDAEQVFSKWGDNSYYELAPDGGFEEGGSGWVFLAGAQLIQGNETEYLNGSEDERALSLPSRGATAVSPRFCVDSTTPAFRVMDMNAGDRDARVRVTVTYGLLSGGDSRSTDIAAGNSWAPSQAIRLETNGGVERAARITFSAKDRGGDWYLDDLYIDPFSRR